MRKITRKTIDFDVKLENGNIIKYFAKIDSVEYPLDILNVQDSTIKDFTYRIELFLLENGSHIKTDLDNKNLFFL